MLRVSSLSLALLLTFSAAGCDAEESLLGEFVGRTSVGAETRAVEGEAVYTVFETPAGPEFVLGLFVGDLFESDTDEYDYVLFRRVGGRPGVGAYPVTADPDHAVGATIARVDEAEDPLESVGALLTGTDGTLGLTRIDDYGFIAGTYAFTAEGIRLMPRGGRVSGEARGTFEARYVPPSTFRRLGL